MQEFALLGQGPRNDPETPAKRLPPWANLKLRAADQQQAEPSLDFSPVAEVQLVSGGFSGLRTCDGQPRQTRLLSSLRSKSAAAIGASKNFESVRAEKEAARNNAACRMLHIAHSLELRGVTLPVRASYPVDAELLAALRPERPGTALNYCRLLERLLDFADADPRCRGQPLVLDAVLTKNWLGDLIGHNVGRHTPTKALVALRYFSALFEFPNLGDVAINRKTASDYKGQVSRAPNRAKGYSKRLLSWLEENTLARKTQSLPDRLVCGRARLAAQASIRNDDMRNTPVAALEWVFDEHQQYIGILTRAAATKTVPRHWSASSLATSHHNDGWLEETIALLRLAHAKDFENDDHLGKLVTKDRLGWQNAPPNGPSDTFHIRTLMLEYNDGLPLGDPERFSDQDISDFRFHGAKATLTSLAQHLGLDRRAVRHQGAWKGHKEDLMPDTYLRDSQRLAMGLQKTCMEHFRSGGDTLEYVTVPIASPRQLRASASAASEPPLPELSLEGSAQKQEAAPCDSSSHETDIDTDNEEEELEGAELFLVGTTSQKYHLVDTLDQEDPDFWSPLCHAARANDAALLDHLALVADVLTSSGKACRRCFPFREELHESAPCEHICGAPLNAGICTNRCSNHSWSCHQSGHACRLHAHLQAPLGDQPNQELAEPGIAPFEVTPSGFEALFEPFRDEATELPPQKKARLGESLDSSIAEAEPIFHFG